MDQKEKLNNLYKDLIDCINNSKNKVQNLQTNETKFEELKNEFISVFSQCADNAQNQMSHIHDNVVWDHLVVAFFGETNAGKSTLIESFRIANDEPTRKMALDKYNNHNFFKKIGRWFYRMLSKDNYQYGVDGEIVGTGDSDFTKQYTEYDLSLKGKRFTLIDVPGIEGKESDYSDIIKEALLKAHCVFYVQGKNKQPDEATASKIKSYLNEWVSVYSIYNVRSNAEKYIDEAERIDLKTNDVRQVEGLIQDTFHRILGSNFKGTLCTQGLLSLCSLARFAKPQRNKNRFNKEKDTLDLHIFEKQKSLIKKQKKLIDLFGSKEKLFEFSRFNDLEKATDEMSNHYLDEIIEANKLKFIKISKDICLKIDTVVRDQQEKISNLENALNKFCTDIDPKVSNTKSYISSDINMAVENSFAELKKYIYNCIDNDTKLESSNIESKAQSLLKSEINKSIKNRIKNLNDDITDLKKDIDNNDQLNISKPNVGILISSINLDEAMKELKINWKDVWGFGISVGSGALGGSVIGPVGTVVGGILGGLTYLVPKWLGDGGKAKAKAKADEELLKAKSKVLSNIQSLSSGINQKIEESINEIKDKLKVEMQNLDSMNQIINQLNKEIQLKNKNIKNTQYGNI